MVAAPGSAPPPAPSPAKLAMAERLLTASTERGGELVARAARMDPVRRYQFLLHAARRVRETARDRQRYVGEVVGVRQFVESPSYMNKRGVLWPAVMEALEELCSGRYTEAVLKGGIGTAKALALDTPIPTPDGWKLMRDVQPGDVVFSETGQPIRVLGAHPVMTGRPCYEVRFSDGSHVVADGEHLWATRTQHQRNNGTGPTVRSTDEIRSGISARHSVPDAEPFVLPDASALGVDPYTLGVWLGDGSADSARVWTVDEEVVREIERYYRVTEQARPDKVPARTVHGISGILRALGLYEEKHVPQGFLRASFDQRLALLQGLMDSDGTTDRRQPGRCSFCQKRRRLAEDVLELVRSLGIRASIREERARIRGRDCGPVYRLAFTVREFPVFRLSRKRDLQMSPVPASRVRARVITAVVPVESVPVRCLTVDNPSGLYLAGRGMVPTHNTTLALYAQAYGLYQVLMLRDPHAEFGMDPSTEIVIVFQSIRLTAARGVDYERFRAMLATSPWFRRSAPHDEQIKSEMLFPKRVIVRPVSGLETAAIGQNVIGGIMDEINFMNLVERSARSTDGSHYDQAQEAANALSRRRESRFLQQGHLAGLLCFVSSSRYPGEFTDRKVEAAATNPHIYVYDRCVWQVKPAGTYSDEMFRVFVGDGGRRPRILGDDELVHEGEAHLVLEAPEDFRHAFEEDVYAALRDIGGVSTRSVHAYIPHPDIVARTFGRHQSVFTLEGTDFETGPPLELDLDALDADPEDLFYAHVDLGLTGDSAGVALGHVPSFVPVERTEGVVEMMPRVRVAGVLEVRPPPGGEIEFSRVRAVLYRLRECGVRLKWVSFDSWQSRDSMQILKAKGFVTGTVSLDKTTYPYDVTKQAMVDARVAAPAHAKCEREFRELILDRVRGRVDHLPGSGYSKDCADAVGGVVYGLTTRREVWLRHKVPLRSVPQYLRHGMAGQHEGDDDDD